METPRTDTAESKLKNATEKLHNVSRHFFEFIQQKNPSYSLDSDLSVAEINRLRSEYLSSILTEELGELSEEAREVIESISQKTMLSGKLNATSHHALQKESFGARLADRVASFGGSWKFIIIFSTLLAAWIILNVYIFKNKGFDPYPFILLNLFLSCIAAIQAPIIMMSQNRQEQKDRQRAKKDYMINLKSEFEIRSLHEKLDHLILLQQEKMIEIEQNQIKRMDQILNEIQNIIHPPKKD